MVMLTALDDIAAELFHVHIDFSGSFRSNLVELLLLLDTLFVYDLPSLQISEVDIC